MTSQRARPQPISRGSSAAWITLGMPTLTSGMPNIASCAAIRKSQAAATSSPPPRHQPGSRAITGAGKWRTASQRSRRRVMKASADFWSSFAISLMSAPPIMLFSLWPARITARMSRSPASFSNPSRTPSVTAELRILSEPALQIVRRTTPRPSRSTPQWGLSMSMAVSRCWRAEGVLMRATSRLKPVLVKGRAGREWLRVGRRYFI